MFNYHHLFYFWKVAKLGSIARAAAELDVTQPTISEQIRLLEKSVGRKLFDRVGRSLILTAAGKTVFSYAEKIFALGSELTQALDSSAARSTALRVGVERGISSRLVASLLPIAAVDIMHSDVETLFNQELDLIIAAQRSNKLHAHRLLDCGTVFVSRNKSSLKQGQLLLPPEPLRAAVIAWLKKTRQTPQIAGSFDSEDLLLAYAERSDGIFPAPDRKPSLKGFQVVTRAPELRYRLFAYTRERRPLHPLIRAVIAL
jgi:LysR family transcriptional activator of nhaA